MKTPEQNINNKQTEKERFDWFIERIQKHVVGWLRECSGEENFMPKNFLEINQYFALTSYCNTIGQSNNAFSILGRKMKSPCFDLFIHRLIKQITNTYQNYFSRSYENCSICSSLPLRSYYTFFYIKNSNLIKAHRSKLCCVKNTMSHTLKEKRRKLAVR